MKRKLNLFVLPSIAIDLPLISSDTEASVAVYRATDTGTCSGAWRWAEAIAKSIASARAFHILALKPADVCSENY